MGIYQKETTLFRDTIHMALLWNQRPNAWTQFFKDFLTDLRTFWLHGWPPKWYKARTRHWKTRRFEADLYLEAVQTRHMMLMLSCWSKNDKVVNSGSISFKKFEHQLGASGNICTQSILWQSDAICHSVATFFGETMSHLPPWASGCSHQALGSAQLHTDRHSSMKVPGVQPLAGVVKTGWEQVI